MKSLHVFYFSRPSLASEALSSAWSASALALATHGSSSGYMLAVSKWALLSFAFAALHALCMPVPLLGSHEGSRRGLKHASLREVRVADNQHQLLLTDPPATVRAKRNAGCTSDKASGFWRTATEA